MLISYLGAIAATYLTKTTQDKLYSTASCEGWFSPNKYKSPPVANNSNTKPIKCRDGVAVFPWSAPKRSDHIENLKNEAFDIVVIGGGCVGAGVALDAATRGLKVALVERDDFAAGTSGRSTKLIHGGVRYLENAFFNLDIGQYNLVKEALAERAHMLNACPYNARALPIMIPLERWWQVPYFWAGTKVYDLLAGSALTVPPSSFINRHQARYVFPMLREHNVYGAIVYYDGQMNDTRFNLLVSLTAAQAGATIVNHCNVEDFIVTKKDNKKYIRGVIVTDQVTGQKIKVNARCVINCTGPFSDKLRKQAFDKTKDIQKAKETQKKSVVVTEKAPERVWKDDLVVPAGGAHVMLPDHFSPAQMGLIVPKTEDGRVLFFLPWEGGTLIGTTDSETPLTMLPRPTGEEVDFVLNESSKYLKKKVKRSDVLAAWSGIRPLVRDPVKMKQMQESDSKEDDTKSLSREHVVEVSDGNMISVLGGKWTTYRQMAEDAVDKAMEVHSVIKSKSGPCLTKNMMLIGSDRAHIVCDQSFDEIRVTLRESYGFDRDIAEHLTRNYGTRALQVAEIVKQGYPTRAPNLHPRRLHPKYPIIEAEIVFSVEQEYALSAEDFLARRTRLAFVDQKVALEVLPNVVGLMGQLLGWKSYQKKNDTNKTLQFLDTMNVKFNDAIGSDEVEVS